MKKHILCLGDSNTYGYYPHQSQGLRFDETQRWTQLLQDQLGKDYLVIEEGLCGRTSVFPDPLTPGLSALDYLFPCAMSHAPVDLLVVMLGTNDTKERFGANAFVIGKGLERLVRSAQQLDCWGGKAPNILLMAPPAIGAEIVNCPTFNGMGADCVEKSRQLPGVLQSVATLTGCHFLDVGAVGCQFNQVDYMHLTAQAHQLLAQTLGKMVPTLVGA